MKRIGFVLRPLLFVIAFQFAESPATVSSAATTNSRVTFRLCVDGVVSPTMTFWIAYGPLGGRFAIVRLRGSRVGPYSISVRLPPGRTSFAYIAGQGVIRDRSGPAPGAPVITIRRIDHSTAQQATQRAVSWHVPVG